ncbi:unnamed protein product [Scytosiphon promiscuus]
MATGQGSTAVLKLLFLLTLNSSHMNQAASALGSGRFTSSLAYLRPPRWGRVAPPARTRSFITITQGSSLVQEETAESILGMTGAKATFLENDGQWISCETALMPSQQEANLSKSSKLHLEKLSVTQLRQEAQQRGQQSTGSKKELMERLVSQEAPAPKRPRRRRYAAETNTAEGYVERQATPRPRPLHPYTPQLRVLSWNVNGIRAQMEKEEGRKALKAIIAQERPHVLGLQEIRISAASKSTPSGQQQRRKKTQPSTPNFAEVVEAILPDYDTFWLSSFPPARQGYSGTALLVRKRRAWDIGCPKLLNIRGGIGHTEGDLEGRVITAELDVAFVVNVYTPNAGAGLKRLGFRTKDWDKAFAAYVCGLENIKPVVVVGDMNVAHQDVDFYNPEQKRMRKAAGTTPEERSSFAVNLLGREPPPSCVLATATAARSGGRASRSRTSALSSSLSPASTSSSATDDSSRHLPAEAATWEGSKHGECTDDDESGDDKGLTNAEGGGCFLVDTFRERHPDATGVFSYWSVRAGNRAVNRGMRLDYCLASRALVGGGADIDTAGEKGELHDAFVLDRETVGVSDHCPVGVVFRLGEEYDE